jgi:hypothetical protein
MCKFYIHEDAVIKWLKGLSEAFYMNGINIDSLPFNLSVQREVFTNYIMKLINAI